MVENKPATAKVTDSDVTTDWVRVHKTLRVTPAIEAKLTDRLWSFEAGRPDGRNG